MSTKETGITKEAARRKRINRMKTVILSATAVWMIVSILSIAVLSYQTMVLGREFRQLKQQLDGGVQGTDSSGQTTEAITEPGALPKGVTETDESIGAGQTGADGSADATHGPEGGAGQTAVSPRDDPQELSDYSGEDTERTAPEQLSTGIDDPDNLAGDNDKHLVYLTFDSEPGDNTAKILDILKKYNVNATFFVQGSEGKGTEDIYRRIVAEGHTLGMHSYSGKYQKIYASASAFRKDYRKISNYLYELTGVRSGYYRFPGGSGNGITNVDMKEFIRVLKEEEITYFDWNVAAADTAESYEAQEVVDSVLDGILKYKTSVVLLHDADDKGETVKALGPLIEELQRSKAQLLPIDADTTHIQYVSADSVE